MKDNYNFLENTKIIFKINLKNNYLVFWDIKECIFKLK